MDAAAFVNRFLQSFSFSFLSVQRINSCTPKGGGLFLRPDSRHDGFVNLVGVLGDELLCLLGVAVVVVLLALLTIHATGMVKDVVKSMLGGSRLFLILYGEIPHAVDIVGTMDVAMALNKVVGFAALQTTINDGEVYNVLMVEGLTNFAHCLANFVPFIAASGFPNALFFGIANENEMLSPSETVFIAVVGEVGESGIGITAEAGNSVVEMGGAGGYEIFLTSGGRVGVEVHDVFLFSFYFLVIRLV